LDKLGLARNAISRDRIKRNNASGPHLDIAAGMFQQMRDQGATDAEIESALEWLERTNPTKADRDVLIVVLEELRRRLGLTASSSG
jgi:hypothetical protein